MYRFVFIYALWNWNKFSNEESYGKNGLKSMLFSTGNSEQIQMTHQRSEKSYFLRDN